MQLAQGLPLFLLHVFLVLFLFFRVHKLQAGWLFDCHYVGHVCVPSGRPYAPLVDEEELHVGTVAAPLGPEGAFWIVNPNLERWLGRLTLGASRDHAEDISNFALQRAHRFIDDDNLQHQRRVHDRPVALLKERCL